MRIALVVALAAAPSPVAASRSIAASSTAGLPPALRATSP
jgi:hypothetical protein